MSYKLISRSPCDAPVMAGEKITWTRELNRFGGREWLSGLLCFLREELCLWGLVYTNNQNVRYTHISVYRLYVQWNYRGSILNPLKKFAIQEDFFNFSYKKCFLAFSHELFTFYKLHCKIYMYTIKITKARVQELKNSICSTSPTTVLRSLKF